MVSPPLHHVRRGSGKPLLLVHGLGGSRRSWDTMIGALAAQREVIAVDLPGFGQTPPLTGDVSIAALADALGDFLVHGPLQEGMPPGSARGPIVLGWGRRDLVTLPRQPRRAKGAVPDARVVWLEGSGHFPPVGCARGDHPSHPRNDGLRAPGRSPDLDVWRATAPFCGRE
jgi:pimeloyl-ACP methyl ester carboxylesterase